MLSSLKQRTRPDIIYQMMQVARHGANRKEIMKGARLSFNQTTNYIALAGKLGLLEYEQESDLYRPTAKGVRFAQVYSEINDALKYATRLKHLYL